MTFYGISFQKYGLFVSAFYLAYSVSQIITGYWLNDKHWKKLLITLILLTLLGQLLTFIQNYYIALFGRLLVGFGSSAGVVGSSRLLLSVLKAKDYNFVFGCIVSITIFFVAILEFKMASYKLKIVWSIFNIIFFILSVLAIAYIYNNSKYDYREKKSLVTKKLRLKGSIMNVLRNKIFAYVSISSGFMVGTLAGFSDSWGIRFFQLKGYSLYQATILNSGVLFGVSIGSFLAPYICNNRPIYSYNLSIMFGIIMCMNMIILATTYTFENSYTMFFLMLSSGVGCAYHITLYLLVGSIVSAEMIFTAKSAFNFITIFCGFISNILISFILKQFYLLYGNEMLAIKVCLLVIALLTLIGILFLIKSKSSYLACPPSNMDASRL